MKKKIKWITVGISVVMIAVIVYLGAVVRYAKREDTTLNHYLASLETMSEVHSVLSIHRFNGLESYVVALVTLTSNHEDVYFFVRDDSVQHYIGGADLLTESQVARIVLNHIGDGEIHHTQLGIIGETPIFEVQITLEDVLHYVVIDALSGDVIMYFNL